jgi:hypothetical protein
MTSNRRFYIIRDVKSLQCAKKVTWSDADDSTKALRLRKGLRVFPFDCQIIVRIQVSLIYKTSTF